MAALMAEVMVKMLAELAVQVIMVAVAEVLL